MSTAAAGTQRPPDRGAARASSPSCGSRRSTPGSDAAVERQHERGQAHRPRAHRPARSTRARSSSSTCSPATAPTASASRTPGRSPTAWSPAGARSTAARCSSSARTSPIFGGALGEVFAEKIHKVMDLAESVGAPMIGLNDGAGARIQEGVVSLDAYGGIFSRNVKASGVIPQISVILGPCAGGAVYSPALTDFVFMVKGTSHMFITGPDVVKTVTGEDVTQEELGGAMHARRRSRASRAFVVRRRGDRASRRCATCCRSCRRTTSRTRRTSSPTTTRDRSCDGIIELIPDAPNKPYDMKKVIAEVVDDGEFLEVNALWAMNIVCGFAPDRRPRRSASSATSRRSSPARSTSTRRRRRRASCARATRSTSRWSRSSTCPASCPAPTRSTAASSATAPSCSTRTARRPCRACRSSPARPTAARTWS